MEVVGAYLRSAILEMHRTMLGLPSYIPTLGAFARAVGFPLTVSAEIDIAQLEENIENAYIRQLYPNKHTSKLYGDYKRMMMPGEGA